MNFYGITYLKNLQHSDYSLQYVGVFTMLFLLFFLCSIYTYTRMQTKYRDISILVLLVLIFFIGIQYSSYQKDEHRRAPQLLHFIYQFAKNQKLNKEEVFVNSTKLIDGLIIKTPNEFYCVYFNPDKSAYKVEKVFIRNVAETRYK
ncbi:hypothetical protein ABE47_18810 [Bacillus thuringiensis]|uniref:DUF3290 family protein n=1 Tax=Bacillus thuringiensis TaxID=1428 RepID=UPI0018CEB4E0|nr:DUF3290 family protein [Bacillus thuringiensis]MBG9504079.1 hypothetical protein [Bacillus thuringiensis]MBG9514147.1 hypothetical protein [Bacillus thuringiensis]